MKSLSSIDSYLGFGSIFKECKNEKTGRINWSKVANYENLPAAFIDKYYCMLKPFNIEDKQTFPEWLIEKKRHKVNWMLLIRSEKNNVDEALVSKCIDALSSRSILFFVLKRIKLSLAFFEKNWEHVLAVPQYKSCILNNISIDPIEISKIISFLEEKESERQAQRSCLHAQRES